MKRLPAGQLGLLTLTERQRPELASSPEIDALLRSDAPVAFGVSGGKDSCALALAGNEYLNQVGHTGPRLLIHSDLGRTEWKDSLPTCERLATATGLELVVVRREKGDMLARWQQRCADNVARYRDLSCVRLILPWSTPSMRFCTSELKIAVICRELIGRFPGKTIISASGIRGEESPDRKKAPFAKPQKKLTSKTHSTTGWDWCPLHGWLLPDVLDLCRERGFRLHEAYERYHSSRVSCCYCILGSKGDLRAAAGCEDNHDVYREMVVIEVKSTFGFQDSQWLGDVAPHLLTPDVRAALVEAKLKAQRREAAEARIPKHLLYSKGWPTCVPTFPEAALLARVRREVAEIVGLEIRYTTPERVIERYEELIAERDRRGAATPEAVESDEQLMLLEAA